MFPSSAGRPGITGAVVAMITAVLLASGWVCPPLSAQDTPRDRARAVLPAQLFRDVEALATEAAGRGVPAPPIFNKALEGTAKRVPPPLLLEALTGYADRLGSSRAAFGPEATTPLLVAGADALQRGVSSEALRSLGENGRHSPLAVLVLADLIETGVPQDRALMVLREAMARRMQEHRMLAIPEEVRGFMRAGHSPNAAAEQVWSRMRRGRGGGGS